MLTIDDDDERIFDALCAGACGYLVVPEKVRLVVSSRPL